MSPRRHRIRFSDNLPCFKIKGIEEVLEMLKRVRDLDCIYTPEKPKRRLFVTFIHLRKNV